MDVFPNRVQKDTSAYWTPQLYYAHANGSFEEVPNYGMTVYYVGIVLPARQTDELLSAV